MNRSLVRRGSSLLGIIILLLAGLAGCGKQEAVPVVRPPAAPVFEPQAVEVKLGESGDSGTLMTTRSVALRWTAKQARAEPRCLPRTATSTRSPWGTGEWTATYNTPQVEVTLGEHGGSATIETAEDGTYRVRGDELVSGGTVMAENGNTYTITQVPASWGAAFVPEMMEIMGLDMMAESRQDGSGYDVGDGELDENGMGDIHGRRRPFPRHDGRHGHVHGDAVRRQV